jgi:hypothetical protein
MVLAFWVYTYNWERPGCSSLPRSPLLFARVADIDSLCFRLDGERGVGWILPSTSLTLQQKWGEFYTYGTSPLLGLLWRLFDYFKDQACFLPEHVTEGKQMWIMTHTVTPQLNSFQVLSHTPSFEPLSLGLLPGKIALAPTTAFSYECI